MRSILFIAAALMAFSTTMTMGRPKRMPLCARMESIARAALARAERRLCASLRWFAVRFG